MRCGIIKAVQSQYSVKLLGYEMSKKESSYYWYINGTKSEVEKAKEFIREQLKVKELRELAFT